MSVAQGFHRLQLEDRSRRDQQIEIVGLAKIFEHHVDGDLGPCIAQTRSDLPLLDLLVEKPADFVVDRKDTLHYVVSQSFELLLIQTSHLRTDENGHTGLSQREEKTDRKMGDRKMNAGGKEGPEEKSEAVDE